MAASPKPDGPTVKELRKIVKARMTYHSYRRGIEDVARGRGKQQRYQWCIAEALRRKQRAFLSRAVCIGIAQDARESRLLVRCVAVDDKLTVRRFMLGMLKDYGSGSVAIRDATRTITHNFCHPRFCHDGDAGLETCV